MKAVSQGLSWLISTGLERLEWNETTRGRSFHPKLFVSTLNSRRPTGTENITQVTCAAVVRSSTLRQACRHVGSECSWHREWLCMQTYRKASLRAGGASHPSGTLGKSLGVMISPSIAVAARRRLPNSYDISSTILPAIYPRGLFAAPSFPSYAS